MALSEKHASLRAHNLVDDLTFACGQGPAQMERADRHRCRAALLSYIADLELRAALAPQEGDGDGR